MLYVKPDMSLAWAETGSIVKPATAKIQSGWISEKPPFENENWEQNRMDVYAQHLDERGIPNWDALVIYNLGSRAFFGTEQWESIQNSNLGQSPVAGSGWWLPVRELAVQPGIIAVWPIATAPSGWLDCRGGNVSRTTYARLFSFLGVSYGDGDGSTTFTLPDYRGYGIRGTSYGVGPDPDRGSRTNRGDGATGDKVGTRQQDMIINHNHPYSDVVGTGAGDRGSGGYSPGTKISGSTGGNETRMKNIYVNFIIRY